MPRRPASAAIVAVGTALILTGPAARGAATYVGTLGPGPAPTGFDAAARDASPVALSFTVDATDTSAPSATLVPGDADTDPPSTAALVRSISASTDLTRGGWAFERSAGARSVSLFDSAARVGDAASPIAPHAASTVDDVDVAPMLGASSSRFTDAATIHVSAMVATPADEVTGVPEPTSVVMISAIIATTGLGRRRSTRSR